MLTDRTGSIVYLIMNNCKIIEPRIVKRELGNWSFWVQIQALTLNCCVILSKLLNLFVPQFPHILNKSNNSIYRIRLL